jgi:acyl phosphate:glycerol-3-phosphate acyltransferase
LICAAVFLAVAVSTRYVSLSSMSAAVMMPLALLISERAFGREVATPVLASSVLFALFILYTHRTNIQRLRRGTELRIGRSG